MNKSLYAEFLYINMLEHAYAYIFPILKTLAIEFLSSN